MREALRTFGLVLIYAYVLDYALTQLTSGLTNAVTYLVSAAIAYGALFWWNRSHR